MASRTGVGVVVSVLMLVGSGGCSGDDKASVASSLRAYLSAVGGGDGVKACNRVGAVSLDSMGGRVACQDRVRRLGERFTSSDREALRSVDIEVGMISVIGNGACATVPQSAISSKQGRLPFDNAEGFQLCKADGPWQIASGSLKP